MALFDKESKQDKQNARAEGLLQRFGLENISDPETIKALQDITRTMAANKFVEVGTALGGTAPDMAKLTYLRALVETNFIIIRQLDKLTK